MFGWCKPRKTFTSKLIDGEEFQFVENDLYLFEDFGDTYNVSIIDDINFGKENFYKKFKVVHRETEGFEHDCKMNIFTYEKVNSTKEHSYLVYRDYKENYYEWLNRLYDFKKDLAFQELIDFEDDERVIDSEISKKIYADFKKYHNEAKIYDEHLEEKYSFIKMYESIMKAFKFASNDGKVKFFDFKI